MPDFRINNTERVRINEEHVILDVKYEGEIPKYVTSRIVLDSYNLPPDSKVKIEAWCRSGNSVQEFYLGTVKNFTNPEEFELSKIVYKGRVRFNLKIVGDNGKLVGLIDDIKSNSIDLETGQIKQMEKIGFLEINWSGDHTDPWRIICDFKNDVTPGISLSKELSKELKDPKAKLMDNVFNNLNFGLVFYEILFQALTHYDFIKSKYDPDSTNDKNKADLVITFAETFIPWPQHLEFEKEPEEKDIQLFKVWVNKVVQAFTEKHKITQKLNDYIAGNNK